MVGAGELGAAGAREAVEAAWHPVAAPQDRHGEHLRNITCYNGRNASIPWEEQFRFRQAATHWTPAASDCIIGRTNDSDPTCGVLGL